MENFLKINKRVCSSIWDLKVPTSTWKFLTLNLDNNSHFLTTSPPHPFNAFFERPFAFIYSPLRDFISVLSCALYSIGSNKFYMPFLYDLWWKYILSSYSEYRQRILVTMLDGFLQDSNRNSRHIFEEFYSHLLFMVCNLMFSPIFESQSWVFAFWEIPNDHCSALYSSLLQEFRWEL
jgi:hypothetical protein